MYIECYEKKIKVKRIYLVFIKVFFMNYDNEKKVYFEEKKLIILIVLVFRCFYCYELI